MAMLVVLAPAMVLVEVVVLVVLVAMELVLAVVLVVLVDNFLISLEQTFIVMPQHRCNQH
jgi:hypothetical protein